MLLSRPPKLFPVHALIPPPALPLPPPMMPRFEGNEAFTPAPRPPSLAVICSLLLLG